MRNLLNQFGSDAVTPHCRLAFSASRTAPRFYVLDLPTKKIYDVTYLFGSGMRCARSRQPGEGASSNGAGCLCLCGSCQRCRGREWGEEGFVGRAVSVRCSIPSRLLLTSRRLCAAIQISGDAKTRYFHIWEWAELYLMPECIYRSRRLAYPGRCHEDSASALPGDIPRVLIVDPHFFIFRSPITLGPKLRTDRLSWLWSQNLHVRALFSNRKWAA
jgi:hypothetical protein